MKKLLIALGAVAIAASVNAASVTWSSGLLKTPADTNGGWSSTTIASGSASGYFWVINEATYNSLYDSDASKMMDNVISKYATLDTANKKVTITDSTYAAPTANTTTITYKDPATYSSGDTAYIATIFTYTMDGADYYIANVGTWTFASSSSKTQGNMATTLGGGTGGASLGGWQAVAIPEPTSGLLLLLGMAGLALKRKHA